jgi:hypothetical protein
MTMFGPLLPGQTAIDDLSGLRLRKIRTVAELNGFHQLVFATLTPSHHLQWSQMVGDGFAPGKVDFYQLLE